MKKDDAKNAADNPLDAAKTPGEAAASPASPDAKNVRTAEPAGSGVGYASMRGGQSQGSVGGTSTAATSGGATTSGRSDSVQGRSTGVAGDAGSTVSSGSPITTGAPDPMVSGGSAKVAGSAAKGDVWVSGPNPSATTMGSGDEGIKRSADTPGSPPDRAGYVSPQSHGGVTGGSTRGAGEAWDASQPSGAGGAGSTRPDVSEASIGVSAGTSQGSPTYSGKDVGGRESRLAGTEQGGRRGQAGAPQGASTRGGFGMEGRGASSGDSSGRFHETSDTSAHWRRFEENRDDPARWRGNQNVESSGAMTNSDVKGAQWGGHDYPWREGVGPGHINEEWSGTGGRSSASSMYEGGGGRSERGWASSSSGTSFGDEARRMAQQGMETVGSSLSGQPREWAMSFVEGQKRSAAESLHNMAEAFRTSVDRLRQDNHPEAAHYADAAASQVEHAAEYLLGQDIEEMFQRTQSFAKRQPELFLGGAFALGFLLTRFLRSHGHGYSAGYREPYEQSRYEWQGGREGYGAQGRHPGMERHRHGQRRSFQQGRTQWESDIDPSGGAGHREMRFMDERGERREGRGQREFQGEMGGYQGQERGERGSQGYRPDVDRYRREYGERLSSQPGRDLRESDTDPSGGASHREMRVMDRGGDKGRPPY